MNRILLEIFPCKNCVSFTNNNTFLTKRIFLQKSEEHMVVLQFITAFNLILFNNLMKCNHKEQRQ